MMGLSNVTEVISYGAGKSNMVIKEENSAISHSLATMATPPGNLQLKKDFCNGCSDIIEKFISEFDANSKSKSVMNERNFSGDNVQAEVDNNNSKSEELEEDTSESQRLEIEGISLNLVDQNRSSLEQDTCDILFEAGYSPSTISKVMAREPEDTLIDSENSTVIEETLECDSDSGNAQEILKEMRIKNVNNIIIGTLNINSLAPKFEQLEEIVGKSLDILTIQETKLDDSFPTQQFILNGYSEPYRLDRNREGGGVLIYVREDIPSKQLTKHKFTKYVEGLLVEINLRKTKLLFFGGYRSEHTDFGLTKEDFLSQLTFALDKYSNYDKVLLAGDFNIDENEEILQDFLFEQNMKNLVKDKTCFKSVENPSCIDLLLTNTVQSFQNTITVTTGLSDFHKISVTVMKTTFPKAEPKIIYYRDYKNFDLYKFRSDLREKLNQVTEKDYFHFELTFLRVLEEHAPMKTKVLRANDKPYMTKAFFVLST